jgi:hypothetical protein
MRVGREQHTISSLLLKKQKLARRINVYIKDKDQCQGVKSCKLTTKWRNVSISCLIGDFNVYGSPLSNNIRLSHRIAPTDIIVRMH